MDIEESKKVIKIAIDFLKAIDPQEEREDRLEEIWIDEKTTLWNLTIGTTTLSFLTRREITRLQQVAIDLESESVVSVKKREV